MTTYNENVLAIVGTEEQMASVMWQMAANAASASENEARRRMQIPHGIAATQTALRMLYNSNGPVHALSPKSRAYVTSEFPSFRVAREGSLITWVTSCYTGGGFFSDALPDLITTLPDMRIGVAEIHRYEGDDMAYARPFNINGKDGLVRCGAVEHMQDPDESYYADDEGSILASWRIGRAHGRSTGFLRAGLRTSRGGLRSKNSFESMSNDVTTPVSTQFCTMCHCEEEGLSHG